MTLALYAIGSLAFTVVGLFVGLSFGGAADNPVPPVDDATKCRSIEEREGL